MSFTLLSGLTPFVAAFAVVAVLGLVLAAAGVVLLVRDRSTAAAAPVAVRTARRASAPRGRVSHA